MGTFSLGAVLRTAWRVWKRNLLPFLVISALIYAPSFVAHSLVPADAFLYLFPLDLFLPALLSAALTYGVVMELNGARPSLRDCVVIGCAQVLPAFGISLISILAASAGLALLVVPGVLVMLNWYVAVPVALIEKLGIMASLRRSRELTLGHRGQILVLFLLYWVVAFGLSFLVQDLFVAVSVVITALTASFGAVLTAVVYTLLRHAKDGTTVPELAMAFARFSRR